MGTMANDTKQQFDFATVFPPKGDPRRPPEWFGRALLYAVIAVFLAWFAYSSWWKLEFLVLDVIISVFVALAMEPLVVNLVRHGWKRGAASAVTLVGLIIVVIVLMGLFGNLFVKQLIGMVNGAPAFYDQMVDFVEKYTQWRMPAMQDLGGEIAKNIQTSWVTDFAGQALTTTVGFFGAIINIMTVLLVTYYISAAGPRLRRSLCQWLGPNSQRRFIFVWTIAQDQISSFLFSRTILALISAACMSVFLVVLKVPYWLPLALFCGLVSQFVPTIGTYIGGAIPIVVAWGSRGILIAVAVLVYIIIYQQIENLLLAPKISERTMDLNPAVAFLSVLAFGAVFGALGAFLALPLAASFQAIFNAYIKHYELIDSPLMQDPKPVGKSKVVEGVEAFNEHVIQPVTSHVGGRSAKGSSARVSVQDPVSMIAEQIYRPPTAEDLDESQTMAIPKTNAVSGTNRLRGVEDAAVDHGVPGSADQESDHAESGSPRSERANSEGPSRSSRKSNPRKGWR